MTLCEGGGREGRLLFPHRLIQFSLWMREDEGGTRKGRDRRERRKAEKGGGRQIMAALEV